MPGLLWQQGQPPFLKEAIVLNPSSTNVLFERFTLVAMVLADHGLRHQGQFSIRPG